MHCWPMQARSVLTNKYEGYLGRRYYGIVNSSTVSSIISTEAVA